MLNNLLKNNFITFLNRINKKDWGLVPNYVTLKFILFNHALAIPFANPNSIQNDKKFGFNVNIFDKSF